MASVGSRLRASVAGLQGGGRGRLLLAVALGWFFVLGMRFVVPAVLPSIRAEFGVSNADTGFAVTVLWVTYAAMQFPAGALTDRTGERVLLVTSLVVTALSLFAYAFTPSFAPFVLATAAFGLGTGLYGPARGMALSKVYRAREGTAFGLVFAAGSVGSAVLPAVAAAVTVAVGWRAALGATAPAFLLVALLYRFVPRDPPADDGTDPDGGASDDDGSAATDAGDDRPAADGGARSLRADLRRSLRAVRSRRVAVGVAGAMLMLFGFQAVTAFLTTYLVDVKGIGQGAAGGFLSLVFVVGALTQPVAGGAADRFGSGPVLAAVAFFSVLPLVAFPLVDARWGLVALAALLGVRMSAGPLSNAYVIDSLPDDVRGTAWGGLRTGFFAVGSLGSTMVGVLADRGLFDASFYVLAGITAVAGVVYLLMPRRG